MRIYTQEPGNGFVEIKDYNKPKKENYYDDLEKRLLAADAFCQHLEDRRVEDIVNKILNIKKTDIEIWPKVKTVEGEIERLSRIK